MGFLCLEVLGKLHSQGWSNILPTTALQDFLLSTFLWNDLLSKFCNYELYMFDGISKAPFSRRAPPILEQYSAHWRVFSFLPFYEMSFARMSCLCLVVSVKLYSQGGLLQNWNNNILPTSALEDFLSVKWSPLLPIWALVKHLSQEWLLQYWSNNILPTWGFPLICLSVKWSPLP